MVEFEESQQQCYPFIKLFVGYEDRRSELTKEDPCLVFLSWRAPVNSLTADLHLYKQSTDLDA